MDDYAPLFEMPTGTDDIESVFKTGRGSTYAHHADKTTTRNRSAANHYDTSTGLQPRSGKTVFIDPRHVSAIAGVYQNPEMATRLIPDPENKVVKLQLMEDYGPRKAGTTLMTAPYQVKPEVGMAPVEVWGSESPIGSDGKNIHFGNKITEVHPRPARLGAVKGAGIAGLLAGAAGASNAQELGNAAMGALPPLAQVLTYAKGAGEGEDEDMAFRRRMAEADALGAANRGRAFDPRRLDLNMPVPAGYRAGGRVRLV